MNGVSEATLQATGNRTFSRVFGDLTHLKCSLYLWCMIIIICLRIEFVKKLKFVKKLLPEYSVYNLVSLGVLLDDICFAEN